MFFLLLNEHENMFDETLFLNILIKEMFKWNECRLELKIIVEQDIERIKKIVILPLKNFIDESKDYWLVFVVRGSFYAGGILGRIILFLQMRRRWCLGIDGLNNTHGNIWIHIDFSGKEVGSE